MLIFRKDKNENEEFFCLEKNFDFSAKTGQDDENKKCIFCFFYDEDLIAKAKQAGADFGILARKKDELFLAEAAGAKYLFVEKKKLAKFAAKAARFYVFDLRILLIKNKAKKLKKIFKLKVDGVIERGVFKLG